MAMPRQFSELLITHGTSTGTIAAPSPTTQDHTATLGLQPLVCFRLDNREECDESA